MKAFEILGGKAMVVELPEGATNLTIDGYLLGYDLPSPDDWGYNYDTIRLAAGTWQIVGRLSEVTEEQAADIVERTGVWLPLSGQYVWYMNYVTHGDCKTALKSIESAIVAERYYLDKNPVPPFNERLNDWIEAQSRVLSRERCLLLRRVGL